MNAKEYAICEICDKAVKARGIGAHKRQAHGIIERIVYTIPDLSTKVDSSTQVADLCTKVDDLSTKVDDLSDDMSQVIDMQTYNLSNLSMDSSTQVPNLSTKVRRPSGFVLKGSVGEKKVFKISDQINSLRETITVQSKVIQKQAEVIDRVNEADYGNRLRSLYANPIERSVENAMTRRNEPVNIKDFARLFERYEGILRGIGLPFKDITGYPKFNTEEEEKIFIIRELKYTSTLLGLTPEDYIADLLYRTRNSYPNLKNGDWTAYHKTETGWQPIKQ